VNAVVFDGALRLANDWPCPTLGPGEARIRTTLAGICNTDLEILRGYAAFSGVLGHEFVGVVESAEEPALVGRRVVGEINLSCGECAMCRTGHREHCTRRMVLGIRGHDGAFADLLLLPERNLHPVPDSVPDEAAVFVEPLAAACRIVEQVHICPDSRVVLLGDGKLGLLVAQVIALTGAELIVVGHHPEKLAVLSSRGIATRLADSDLKATANIVVECTGRPDGFRAAQQLVRPGGILILKSTYQGRVEADLTRLVVDEIAVIGSRCGPFPAALRLLEQGLVDVHPLIAAEYPLVNAVAAFEHAALRGTLKVLLRPEP
jgi:threonine dehydrogenase-like Zn-dependent dehydrogenase